MQSPQQDQQQQLPSRSSSPSSSPQTTRSITGYLSFMATRKRSRLVSLIAPEVTHRRELSPCSTPCAITLHVPSSLTSEIVDAATPVPIIVTSPTLRYHSFANAVTEGDLNKEEDTIGIHQVFCLDHITSSSTPIMSNSTLTPPLSRPHRGSMSSPCIPTLSALNDQEPIVDNTTQASRPPLPPLPPLPPHSLGSKTSARTFISRAVGFGQMKAAAMASGKGSHPPPTCTTGTTREMTGKTSIASHVANEVLSLIFRHLMDRKSILNCSLVSTHWHGPARLELARIVQDMPFNGQGLVHAIR